jgi:hypothetical protein
VKILVITHAYSPQVSPRSIRWSTIIEHLSAKYGAEIDVLTLLQPGSAADENKGGVHIHRVRSRFDTYGSAHVATSGTNAAASSKLSLKAAILPLAKWIYRRTWQKLMWPDYACLWIPAAKKAALDLCARNSYDRMISVSHPFTSHVVGLAVKEKYPKLPWMVDIGDPFALLETPAPNNRALFDRRNHSVERRVLALANSVSVTTPATLEKYETIFPESKGKSRVIPPVYKRVTLPENAGAKTGAPKLVFVGTLYKTIRSPLPLLELFEQLTAKNPSLGCELHFYGGINDCGEVIVPFSEKFKGKLFVHGLVPLEKARAAMASSTAIVNLGNENAFQLPSKTVECLASGKPILNIVTSAEDSSIGVFAGHPALMNIQTRQIPADEHLVDELARFISSAPQVPADWVKTSIAPYEIDAVGRAYWELLEGR